ncbi:hypothetical protein F4780DRAFT_792352 [Xylariomycetidae sp. FL0641]|nr:hypothetical protein F4780DRAFT_792352 [Xylariomycetidae sp. FL0641]
MSSPVLLAVATRHACYNAELVTEVSYSLYDTKPVATGDDIGQASVGHKNIGHVRRYHGDPRPGDRGQNYAQRIFSFHVIVKDTADHHLGTCANVNHRDHPYGFGFRKSRMIDRDQITKVIQSTFEDASIWRLTPGAIQAKLRRPVILVSFGMTSLSRPIQQSKWFRTGAITEHWDIRQHPVARDHFPPLQPGNVRVVWNQLGLVYTVNGYDAAKNSGNYVALMLQFLLVLSYITDSQMKELENHQPLPALPAALGLEVTMTKINHPPREEPLTEAPSCFVLPNRPDRDLYHRV